MKFKAEGTFRAYLTATNSVFNPHPSLQWSQIDPDQTGLAIKDSGLGHLYKWSD